MNLSYYFVAFVDLLGQSDALAQIKSLPKTDEEKAATFKAMTETGVVVKNVRNSFSDFFEGSKHLAPEILEKMHPLAREEFAEIRAFRVFQLGFSDSFVIGIPLAGDDSLGRARAANEVWSALFGLATLSLRALADGIPLRGGIDIGLGMQIFPGEVYGPVLLSAYRYESKVAEYPRAAISPNVPSYLQFLGNLPPNSVADEFASSMAFKAREFVCEAPDDGWPMLHFLSQAVKKGLPSFDEDQGKAHRFVMDQIKRYAEAKDDKLVRRYVRLARYFDRYGAR